MRALPFELSAPQTSRSPVTVRTEFPKREAKSSRRGKRDNGKGRAPPCFLLRHLPVRADHLTRRRYVGFPTLAKNRRQGLFPGEMARKPRRHRTSEQFRSAQ